MEEKAEAQAVRQVNPVKEKKIEDKKMTNTRT